MKTKVINIYGAPGSGKSTLAAELYTALKKQGTSVELVREQVKTWIWSGHTPNFFEQVFVTNLQMKEETSHYGKVEYLITDSPIMLGGFYAGYYHNDYMVLDRLYDSIQDKANMLGLVDKPLHLYLDLKKGNKEGGRLSGFQESQNIDAYLRYYLSFRLGNDLKHCDEDLNNRLNYCFKELGK